MTREGRNGKRDSVRRIIEPTVNDLSCIYRALRRIRRVEEEIVRIYPTDKIKSPVHLTIGQEAVAVGVCDHLARGDAVFVSYRGHATYLAKGGGLKEMIAELYGKVTGCGRGKAGSMHLVDMVKASRRFRRRRHDDTRRGRLCARGQGEGRRSGSWSAFFGEGARKKA